MKIGILTFHRACNYGAVLQCFALQEVLKSMGHEVRVIDYRQPFIENAYRYFRPYVFLHYCKYIKWMPSYLYEMLRCYRFKWYFKRFRSRYLCITDKCPNNATIPSNYDCYIVGSDQLYNVHLTGGLDSVFSLDFKSNEHALKIGYAISMDASSLESIGPKWQTIYNRFSAFSVREDKYAKGIEQFTRTAIQTCVDPTLLTDASLWANMAQKRRIEGKYIALYQVRWPQTNKSALYDKALKLAKDNGYKLIDLSSKKYSVDQWVSLIAHAERVVTSSFHATVFALIFHRPVHAFVLHDGWDDRYTNLLKALNLDCCLTELDDSIDEPPLIDWNRTSEKMLDFSASSIDFLKQNLSK